MPESVADIFLTAAILPRIVGAVVILVLGWIAALIVSSIVRGLLRRTAVDNRLATALGGRQGLRVEEGVATAVFYFILLFVLVAALQALNLTLVTGPLTGLLVIVLSYIPRLVAAGVLLLIAWVLATVLRTVVSRGLAAARIDERIGNPDATARRVAEDGPAAAIEPGAPSAPGATSLAQTLGDVVYWLVFLLFLPGVLGTLGLEGLLAPVRTMLDRALGFLPNVVAAALIVIVGFFVAGLVRRIVTNLLAAAGADRLADRVGLGATMGTQRLSSLLGLVVYVLIAIPVLTAGLDALQMEALTRPISNMLSTILNAIPNVFAAALLLAVAYAIGRVVSTLVASLLAGIGFNALPARLGVGGVAPTGGRSLSEIAGSVVLVLVMLFAGMEAARLLGFAALTAIMAQFMVFLGHVLLGVVILGIGLFLANLADGAVRSSGVAGARLLANVARAAILVLAGTMTLREMGLGEEIITLAFGLTLGAIAVAAALAFGLGGRAVAARELESWIEAAKAHDGRAGAPGLAGVPRADMMPGDSS
jgi:hypothetical protein